MNHERPLLLTPFAGLLNLGRRFGVPDEVLAPALRGAGVPEAVDLSATIENLTRQAVAEVPPLTWKRQGERVRAVRKRMKRGVKR